MFERFTTTAREIVVAAQSEARNLGAEHIGTEHLLLAITSADRSSAAAALARHGLDANVVRRALVGHADELDAEALGDLGIDLDAVRERIEASFGVGALDRPARPTPGHLPFTKPAKKALELSLREAIRLGDTQITDRHLLLGLLRGDGDAPRIIAGAGIDPEALRDEVSRGNEDSAQAG